MNNFDLRKFLYENKLTTAGKLLGENILNITPDDMAYDVAGIYAKDIIPGSEKFTYGPDEDGTYQFEFKLGFDMLDGISPEEKEDKLNNEIGGSEEVGPGKPYTQTRITHLGEENGEHVFVVYQRGGYNF